MNCPLCGHAIELHYDDDDAPSYCQHNATWGAPCYCEYVGRNGSSSTPPDRAQSASAPVDHITHGPFCTC